MANDYEEGILGEGTWWQTSYYVNDSREEGPTVIITGGIHGNEPAGARAAEQIRHWPIVRGKLIVVPRVNTIGLAKDTRYIPGVNNRERDLNRNFPSPDLQAEPRGEIALALWAFVVERKPDWLFDLHEGYEFNISHKPKPGRDKSVGSSIIHDRSQGNGPLIERMLIAANGTVTNANRKFVLLSRGPKRTSLASAAIHVLGKPAMILETTFSYQPLSIRTHQHRVMMNVALMQLGMISGGDVDVGSPADDDSALQDGPMMSRNLAATLADEEAR